MDAYVSTGNQKVEYGEVVLNKRVDGLRLYSFITQTDIKVE